MPLTPGGRCAGRHEGSVRRRWGCAEKSLSPEALTLSQLQGLTPCGLEAHSPHSQKGAHLLQCSDADVLKFLMLFENRALQIM